VVGRPIEARVGLDAFERVAKRVPLLCSRAGSWSPDRLASWTASVSVGKPATKSVASVQ
jgi:hypothetical protein